jgi:drug/metabolite transporter (DMT)-like permease
MTAIFGGLGAAVAFAVSTLCAVAALRESSVAPFLAWVAISGVVIGLPLALLTTGVPRADGRTLGLLATGGAGDLLGMGLGYIALGLGKVGVVSSITASGGAVAALISIIGGEPASALSLAALALITCGVLVAAHERPSQEHALGSAPQGGVRMVAFASASAVFIGIGFYATGRAAARVPLVWSALPPRVIGAMAIALPLAAMGRLRVRRRVLQLGVTAGAAEVLGFLSFGLGARSSVAVASVLASLFGALAATGAFVLFGQRLRPDQLAAGLAILVGLVLLQLQSL